MALSGYRVANVAVGRAVITSGTVQHAEIELERLDRGNVPVVDNTVAVKRFFQNQAATGLNNGESYTLTVANSPHRSCRGSPGSRNAEVRRIGRDAIRARHGSRLLGTRIAADADGAPRRERKYTTAGTGAFLLTRAQKHYERL